MTISVTTSNKRPTIVQAANGMATLAGYSDGKLRYLLLWHEPDNGISDAETPWYQFEFPVDVANDAAATGEFSASMKGVTLMRWIRQEFKRLDDEIAMIADAKANWNPDAPTE